MTIISALRSGHFVGKDKQFYYSFLAGLCACGGSVFGKLSSAEICNLNNLIVTYFCSTIFIILMLVCNGALFTCFVKALQESPSSFAPALSVAATNYLLSALMGVVLFNESLTWMWCLGTALILSGLGLIASDSEEPKKVK